METRSKTKAAREALENSNTLITSYASHENLMFSKVNIRLNKEKSAMEGEQVPPVQQQEANSKASTSALVSEAKSNSPTSVFVPADNTNMMQLPRVSWFVRVVQFVQSALGAIGGAYAVWHLTNTYIFPTEEKFEVIMVKRS